MPNFRLPTCVDSSARGKPKPRAASNADGACGSFRDRTLTWFRLGEELEADTGAYELETPEHRSHRTAKILVAVSATAGLLIALAFVVAS